MHIPLTPPDATSILVGLAPEQLLALFGQGGVPSPLINGHYLHWDEIRHRTPPDGLTLERVGYDGWTEPANRGQPLP